MGLEVGILGLPNIGKSTLFKAITQSKAEIANFPFCTIEPNVGIASVPDPRLDFLAKIFQPLSVKSNFIKVVDIAGLIKKASKGEGLGNRFLGHLSQVNVYIHLVRCYNDPNIIHVEQTIDPKRDVEIIRTELILFDIEKVQKKVKLTKKQMKANKNLSEALDFYHLVLKKLNEGTMIISSDLIKYRHFLKELDLITAKPFIYVMNISDKNSQTTDKYYQTMQEIAKKDNTCVLKINCALESELTELSNEEQAEFIQELNSNVKGLDLIVKESFNLLNQISFFTAGKKEVRAWNITQNSTAHLAASKIHTDIQKGFIKSEVYHFNDMQELKSEQAIKKNGKIRLEGRDYIVKDGDIMFFHFNI